MAHSTELALSTPSTKAAARRLRRTRQQLGTYRHDLLVAMRVVNTIEREMLLVEWENWIMDEMFRCNQIERLIRGNDTSTSSGGGAEVLRQWHAEYCGSCRIQQLRLEEQGQGRRWASGQGFTSV